MLVQSIAVALALVVQVEPQQLTPGTPVRITVSGAGPGAVLSGTFLDRPLHFLPRPDGSGWTAFAGIDLAVEPGPRELIVEAREPDGLLVEEILDLTIAPKEFPVEHLTVAKAYVEPPPEVAERIARESAMVRALWDEVTPKWLAGGLVERPLGNVKGRNFGRRRFFNGKPRSPHSGSDLRAPMGTPVNAAAAGRVVLAEELYFSGNLIVINHGGGIYTLYAHLSSIDVKVGDRVMTSTRIGRVGATGRVTGAHLHWGAHIGHARVDPSTLLELMSADGEPAQAAFP